MTTETDIMQQQAPLHVVITGASRGLGFALAAAHLSYGDRIAICARNPANLERACEQLRAVAEADDQVIGFPCDVGSPQQVANFADFVKCRLGHVDRWINNAGTAGRQKRPLWALANEDIAATNATNLSSVLLGCAEAVRLMRSQETARQPRYHIFNLGFTRFGANHSRTPVPHKASKLGVAAVTRYLAQELKEQGVHSIGVHEISPGLVNTELLLTDTTPAAQTIIALLAEPPEPVAATLVPQIRNIRGATSTLTYRSQLGMLLRVARHLPSLLGKRLDR
ncbi:SDR family oxidoreductase [Halorhodospira abdelmalekii]|uniref:SDR family oxidoreductase n=1 Tax=Halorhodospira abdelmalekii TaxID=421629 RepID=UPI0019030EF1|nr:SDR family oxidoreductase [Halorhodospira abdelmalekii]